MRTILIAGATGLVGSHVRAYALNDERVTRVVAPTRKPLQLTNPKLLNPVIDFHHLPIQEDRWSVDTFICALGTSSSNVTAPDSFEAVDYEYPLAMASVVRQHGGTSVALCSAQGATPRSPLRYFRIKGELEGDLRKLGYCSVIIVKPGLIGGRLAPSQGERIALSVLRRLELWLPRRLRINPADVIARALMHEESLQTRGLHLVTADMLVEKYQSG